MTVSGSHKMRPTLGGLHAHTSFASFLVVRVVNCCFKDTRMCIFKTAIIHVHMYVTRGLNCVLRTRHEPIVVAGLSHYLDLFWVLCCRGNWLQHDNLTSFNSRLQEPWLSSQEMVLPVCTLWYIFLISRLLDGWILSGNVVTAHFLYVCGLVDRS